MTLSKIPKDSSFIFLFQKDQVQSENRQRCIKKEKNNKNECFVINDQKESKPRVVFL